jgi:hypothetical protein
MGEPSMQHPKPDRIGPDAPMHIFPPELGVQFDPSASTLQTPELSHLPNLQLTTAAQFLPVMSVLAVPSSQHPKRERTGPWALMHVIDAFTSVQLFKFVIDPLTSAQLVKFVMASTFPLGFAISNLLPLTVVGGGAFLGSISS